MCVILYIHEYGTRIPTRLAFFGRTSAAKQWINVSICLYGFEGQWPIGLSNKRRSLPYSPDNEHVLACFFLFFSSQVSKPRHVPFCLMLHFIRQLPLIFFRRAARGKPCLALQPGSRAVYIIVPGFEDRDHGSTAVSSALHRCRRHNEVTRQPRYG